MASYVSSCTRQIPLRNCLRAVDIAQMKLIGHGRLVLGEMNPFRPCVGAVMKKPKRKKSIIMNV